MSFNINNKLIASNSLVTNLSKDDFKYLSQEFQSKVSKLVRLFEKFKELNSNEKL